MTLWFLTDEGRAHRGIDLGARQAGINKASRAKKPSSRTDGSNRGRAAKHRISCWECPPNPNASWMLLPARLCVPVVMSLTAQEVVNEVVLV